MQCRAPPWGYQVICYRSVVLHAAEVVSNGLILRPRCAAGQSHFSAIPMFMACNNLTTKRPCVVISISSLHTQLQERRGHPSSARKVRRRIFSQLAHKPYPAMHCRTMAEQASQGGKKDKPDQPTVSGSKPSGPGKKDQPAVSSNRPLGPVSHARGGMIKAVFISPNVLMEPYK